MCRKPKRQSDNFMKRYKSKSKRLLEVFFSKQPLRFEPVGKKLKMYSGLWYFRVLRRENREIIASSEGYSRRIDCISTAKLVTGGRLKVTVIK